MGFQPSQQTETKNENVANGALKAFKASRTLNLDRLPSVEGREPDILLLFRKILRAVAMLPSEAGISPGQIRDRKN